jgi:uncharacterized protein
MGVADSSQHPKSKAGWRRLGVFWATVLGLISVGSGVLEWLGPPESTASREAGTRRPAAALAASRESGAAGTVVLATPPMKLAPLVVGRDTPGPVLDPDPGLLEPAAQGSTDSLPRVAPDGRTAMTLYAAGFDRSSRRPRVGLLLAGVGLNEAESDTAIRTLPGAVSLAFSPYGAGLPKLAATARAAGHEYLIAIPLEPTGFPLNDPGPYTLLTSAPPPDNIEKLHWSLSRLDGYVGASGIIGTMRGERLAAMTDQMEAMLSELAQRGLLYVDPRTERGPLSKAWGRHADLVVDDPADRGEADRAMIDSKLAALEQLAKDTGSALGLVMRPTPVAVARIAAWTVGLADRGLALAPVSALVAPPSEKPVKMTEREK